MSKIDDDLKAHARSNLIRWIHNASWFVAGIAVGILVCRSF